MNTQTLTHTETRKKNGYTFVTTYTVVREPATLSEHRMLRPRWFDYVGDHVQECYKVTVTTETKAGSTYTDTYFEIVTPFGRGAITSLVGSSELSCWIPTSGPVLLTGCWKKYNMYRGHVLAYAMAMGVRPESRTKTLHTCSAHVYAIAAGKSWGTHFTS